MMTPNIANALQSTALVGAIVRPLLVAVLLFCLWRGLTRAGRSTRRILPWSIVAAFLIGWLAAVWMLAARAIFARIGEAGALNAAGFILLPIVLLVAGALAVLTRSKTMSAAIDASPLWWLVAFQSYRISGFIFLRLWAAGFLPGYFALPAGIGDTLTGALSIGAAVALWKQLPWARRFAYGVNIFGIADLLNAVSMAVLAGAKSPTGMSPLLVYPLSIVPTFGVPLAFIVHGLSLWQLRRNSGTSTADIANTKSTGIKRVLRPSIAQQPRNL